MQNITVGHRFGKLVVVECLGVKERGSSHPRTWWRCACDCGGYTDVRHDKLTGKVGSRVVSCGCEMGDKKFFPGETYSNTYKACSIYVVGALRRNLEWELTYEDTVRLLGDSCFYCGSMPQRIVNEVLGDPFVCGGIDRLDSEKGYSIENCVSCCSDCNYLKNAMNVNEFLDRIALIYMTCIKKRMPEKESKKTNVV